MQVIAPVTINSIPSIPLTTDLGLFVEIYYDGTNWIGVEESDSLQSPLPAQVTAAKTSPISSLTSTAFVIPEKFFGMHTAGSFPSDIVYGSCRSHDSNVHWGRLETARGVYDSSVVANLDSMVAYCAENNIDFVYIIPFTPAWASSNPTSSGDGNGTGTAWCPASWTDLTNHVNYVLNRYGTQIHAVEGWNEPNTPTCYKDSMANLVMHQQTIWNAVQAYNVAHGSAIKVVTASYTDDPNSASAQSLNNFLAAGGGAYCDVVGYHTYSGDHLGLRVNRDHTAKVKTVMANRGVSAKDLWITEVGDSLISTHGNDDWITQHLLHAAAQGVKKFFWYNYPGGGIGDIGLYQVPEAWERARLALSGKTVQWVNALKSMKLAASINNVVNYV